MHLPSPIRGATRAGLALTILGLLVGLCFVSGPAAGAAGNAATSCRFQGLATAVIVNGHRTTTVRVCTDTVGVHRLRAAAARNFPNRGRVASASSRMVTLHRSRPYRITSQTHTGRVSLFGVIRARAVMARSTATTRRHNQLVGRTVFTDLRIQGKSMPTHPKRNQTIALPGIGKVVLNQQSRSRSNGRLTVSVTAMRIVVGKNNPAGLPSGSVVLGQTMASVAERG